jgi:hypothetical protein
VFDPIEAKVGEELVLRGFGSGDKVVQVKDVTPTGIIKVSGTDATFRPDGRMRGGKDNPWRNLRLVRPDPRKLEEIRMVEVRRSILRRLDWNALKATSDAKVRRIAAALDSADD